MGQIFLMMMGVTIFLLIIKLLLKRWTPFSHYACKTSKQGFCAKFATFRRKFFSLLMHFRCILVEVQTGLGKSWQIGAVARYMMLQKIKLEAIKLKVDHLRCLLCICISEHCICICIFLCSDVNSQLISFIVFCERAACELWPIVSRWRLIVFESRFQQSG